MAPLGAGLVPTASEHFAQPVSLLDRHLLHEHRVTVSRSPSMLPPSGPWAVQCAPVVSPWAAWPALAAPGVPQAVVGRPAPPGRTRPRGRIGATADPPARRPVRS